MTLELPKIGPPKLFPGPDYATLNDLGSAIAGLDIPDDVSESVLDLLLRVSILEDELARLVETNELLRRILAEVTKQRIIVSEAANERITNEDVKEVWQ